MTGVMSSTSYPAVAALGWAHIYFSGRLYYFLELLEAHDFLREALFCNLKIILLLLCHGDTLGELVNTPWTHHVLHLFLFSGIPSPRMIWSILYYIIVLIYVRYVELISTID